MLLYSEASLQNLEQDTLDNTEFGAISTEQEGSVDRL